MATTMATSIIAPSFHGHSAAAKAFGDHARCVKRIAGNQKLDPLTTAKVRADYDAFACAIDVQHQ